MLELLDRIKGRNLGTKVELKSYTGKNPADLRLITTGINAYSVFANGTDIGVTLYDFNLNRKPEFDANGKFDKTKEIDYIIGEIIRAKFN